MSNLMKIHPLRAELFHADGWTDIVKLIVAFRNFVNAPKNKDTYLLSRQNVEFLNVKPGVYKVTT